MYRWLQYVSVIMEISGYVVNKLGAINTLLLIVIGECGSNQIIVCH